MCGWICSVLVSLSSAFKSDTLQDISAIKSIPTGNSQNTSQQMEIIPYNWI